MNHNLSQLKTEQWNQLIPALETVDTLTMVTVMNREDQTVAHAVAKALPKVADAIDLISQKLFLGGRMFYVGAGTSGRLGLLDAAECPPTFNTTDEVQAVLAGGIEAFGRAREGIEDSVEAAEADLAQHGFNAADVVVGLAASGRTPYVIGALRYACSLGAATVSVACNTESELESWSDVAIAVDTGAEVILGSTRLKAGTAQKLVLNMLSTGTMVRLGKTHRNFMVDMHATNLKLVERARRIVMLAAECDYSTAAETLAEADGSVKVAIVMVAKAITRDLAEALLKENDGRIGQALMQSGHRVDG